MFTQEVFLFSAILTPLVLIAIFGYKKNPIYFVIGMQLAFYIGHSLYEIYLSLNIYNLNNIEDIAKIQRDVEAHRSTIFSNNINSIFVVFAYVMIVGTLFWNVQKNKYGSTQQTFRVFFNSSLFYFLLFWGSLIDLLMTFIVIWFFSVAYWRFSIFSLPLMFVFLIKAISLKYPAPKESRGKTSKLTWVMFIFFVLFFAFIIYIR